MTTSQTGGGGGALSALVALLISVFRSRPAATPVVAPVSAPVPPPVAPTPSDTDIDILARTLWGEARGEPDEGVEAVAAVILNRRAAARDYLAKRPDRSRHPLFGSGALAAVCLANPEARWRQFSCWNTGDPNRAKLEKVTEVGDARFRFCLDVARRAVAGSVVDKTGGATHYHDRRIADPTWTVGAIFTVEIGHHRFYKAVP